MTDDSNIEKDAKAIEFRQRVIAIGIMCAIGVCCVMWPIITHDPNLVVKEGIQLHSGYFFGATPEEIREFESVANGGFKVGHSCLSQTKSLIPIACATDDSGKQYIFFAVERSGKTVKKFLTGSAFLEKLRIENEQKNFKAIAVFWPTKLHSNRYGVKRPAIAIQMENRKGMSGVACLPYSIDKGGSVGYERMREAELKPLDILFTRDKSVKPMFEWVPPAKTKTLPEECSEFKKDTSETSPGTAGGMSSAVSGEKSAPIKRAQ